MDDDVNTYDNVQKDLGPKSSHLLEKCNLYILLIIPKSPQTHGLNSLLRHGRMYKKEGFDSE